MAEGSLMVGEGTVCSSLWLQGWVVLWVWHIGVGGRGVF